MEINDLIGLWPGVLHSKKKGELTKADVVEALRSDEPIPREARELLADYVEGKPTFKPGPKTRPAFEKQMILMLYRDARAWGEKTQRGIDTHEPLILWGVADETAQQAKDSLSAGDSPREIALELVAEVYGYRDPRQIEKYIAEDRDG